MSLGHLLVTIQTALVLDAERPANPYLVQLCERVAKSHEALWSLKFQHLKCNWEICSLTQGQYGVLHRRTPDCLYAFGEFEVLYKIAERLGPFRMTRRPRER